MIAVVGGETLTNLAAGTPAPQRIERSIVNCVTKYRRYETAHSRPFFFGAEPFHDVVAKPDNQAALFSHWDEFRGRNRPKCRVGPSGESLEPNQPIRNQVELWLVVYGNTCVFQRTSKLMLKRHALSDRISEILGEEHGMILAASLGGVHRTVSLLQQIHLVACVIGKSANANTGADGDFLPLDVKRPPQPFQQAFCYRLRIVLPLDAVQYDRKLVPTETRQDVRLSNS